MKKKLVGIVICCVVLLGLSSVVLASNASRGMDMAVNCFQNVDFEYYENVIIEVFGNIPDDFVERTSWVQEDPLKYGQGRIYFDNGAWWMDISTEMLWLPVGFKDFATEHFFNEHFFSNPEEIDVQPFFDLLEHFRIEYTISPNGLPIHSSRMSEEVSRWHNFNNFNPIPLTIYHHETHGGRYYSGHIEQRRVVTNAFAASWQIFYRGVIYSFQ